MAIIIIGEDNAKKKRVTCLNCASILEYTLADTYTEVIKDYGGGSDTYRRIKCPACGDIVTVS